MGQQQNLTLAKSLIMTQVKSTRSFGNCFTSVSSVLHLSHPYPSTSWTGTFESSAKEVSYNFFMKPERKIRWIKLVATFFFILLLFFLITCNSSSIVYELWTTPLFSFSGCHFLFFIFIFLCNIIDELGALFMAMQFRSQTI